MTTEVGQAIAKARLIFDVDLILNEVPPADLLANLKHIVQEAIEAGRVTGNSAAEMGHYKISATLLANPLTFASNDEIPIGKAGRLTTLDGQPIKATYEVIPGETGIVSATRNEDGSLDITFDGETKVCWDGQLTGRDDMGELQFLTEDGDLVSESAVKLMPDGEFGEGAE